MRTSKKAATTSSETPSVAPTDDSLTGVPGIGPVRIIALKAAGIETRSDLAKATVEQLVSVAGMQRAYAIKALEAVRGERAPKPPAPVRRAYRKAVKPTVTEDAPVAVESVEPEVPVVPEEPESPSAPEAEPAPLSALDQAQLSLKTAIADATRRFAGLERPLTRIAKSLEKLPGCVEYLSNRKQLRLAAQLEDLTARLEKARLQKGDLSGKREEKLREHIRENRRALVKIIKDTAARGRTS